MIVKNLKYFRIFDCHFLIWQNIHSEFKFIKVENRMYKKYSIYLWKFIFEIDNLKYGTNSKPISTNTK
jgi:hypothetical protein